nr:hypothetical protein Iba_chr08bCG1460 [Ipomoea batatas]GMD24457.1 hypothetical protein Iba_chr08cCG0850 [Ipomoea batatas]GME04299.1 hypothetical protein Iba_scaffold1866CG0240 [Ipomoea batatas]
MGILIWTKFSLTYKLISFYSLLHFLYISRLSQYPFNFNSWLLKKSKCLFKKGWTTIYIF